MSANDPSLINRTTVAVSRAIAGILLMILAATPVSASKEVNKSRFGGVAIKGYDTVAYHLEGKPVEGSKDFVFEWQEATWRFANAENRDRFAAEPQRWAPAYGGWCAYGVSKGVAFTRSTPKRGRSSTRSSTSTTASRCATPGSRIPPGSSSKPTTTGLN